MNIELRNTTQLRGKGALACPKCGRVCNTADGMAQHIVKKHHGFTLAQYPVDFKGTMQNVFVETKKQPCGECHLQDGETCDVCGARAA